MALRREPTTTEYHSLTAFRESDENANKYASYVGHVAYDAESIAPIRNHSRGWIKTLLLQLLGLLWLVPIVFLLVLNFENHIVGASAWCPGGNCWVDAFNVLSSVPQQNLQTFDKNNHNLLGSLQLVSKALEVWFIIIATSLVYIVTMMLASRPEGLPIGYLFRPSEYSELPSLLDRVMWTAHIHHHSHTSPIKPKNKLRIYLFLSMTVLLCIISNLMGPATAVLVLPSLQWLDSPQITNETFGALNSANAPSAQGFLGASARPYTYCTSDELAAGQYSCTANPWASSLDAWIDSYAASQESIQGISSQDAVAFAFNYTFLAPSADEVTDVVYWAPSRQLISDLSEDQQMVGLISLGYNASQTSNPAIYDSYVPYNNSLQLLLQRSGPIIGAVANQWIGTPDLVSTTLIDKNRQIRCYARYQLDNTPLVQGSASGNYTKCLRVGTGWNATNKVASFAVDGAYYAESNTLGPIIDVNVYFSDAAAFLPNGTLPSSLSPACLVNGTLGNSTICDWSKLFTLDPYSPVANRSSNVNTIEFTMSNASMTAILTADFVAFSAFTDYTLDPSPLTNPISLVQTQNLPNTGSSIVVDPAWTLAAWSVDNNGVLPANRATTLTLQMVMTDAMNNTGDPNFTDVSYDYDFITLLPIIQTLSLIDYVTKPTLPTAVTDPAHPLLQRNAKLYVWAYGISSRTAILGAIVTIIGIVVVLVQFVLGLVDRRRRRSPTELLVAALEHSPQGEFSSVGKTEEEMAKVRFHIREDYGTGVEMRFHART